MERPLQNSFMTAEQAEQAFYDAFRRCDSRAMAAVWADDDVICIHPGSHVIVGYDAITRSWSNIFSSSQLPALQTRLLKTSSDENLAVHIVEEVLMTEEDKSVSVLATNVYRKYASGWHMVEHHGSLVQAPAGPRTLQ